MKESVILCEGYYDRAFWKGWLTYIGCNDLSRNGKPVLGPDGTPVTKGQHGYHSPDEKRFIRVVPCNGKPNVLKVARDRIQEHRDKPWDYLIVNVDSGLNADGSPNSIKEITRQGIADMVGNIDPNMSMNKDDIKINIGSKNAQVLLIEWKTSDLPSPGLPNQQTLERLVCAAITASYPNRANNVQQWLEARDQPPSPDPKEHAWSYMAGWYAVHGCEDFFRTLWDDEKIMIELRMLLEQSSAWRIVSALIA